MESLDGKFDHWDVSLFVTRHTRYCFSVSIGVLNSSLKSAFITSSYLLFGHMSRNEIKDPFFYFLLFFLSSSLQYFLSSSVLYC